MKKIICILVAICLVICIMPVSAFAVENSTRSVSPFDVGRLSSDGRSWVIQIAYQNYLVAINTLLVQGNTSYIREVYVAQEAINNVAYLNQQNFNCGAPDGIFGTGTYTAVRQFQQYYNSIVEPYLAISVDGKVGNESWSRLSILSA